MAITFIFLIVLRDVRNGKSVWMNINLDSITSMGVTEVANVTGGQGKQSPIVGLNGEVLNQKKKNPSTLGIEELVALQSQAKGMGVGMTSVEITTVLVYELHRTKQFALKLADIVNNQSIVIEELRNGHGKSSEKS